MDVVSLLRRLAGMGPGELARRAARRGRDRWQWKRIERDAREEASAGSLDALLDGPLLPEPEEDLLREAGDSTVERALGVLDGSFTLYGRRVTIPRPVDWLADPLAGGSAAGMKTAPVWSELYRRRGVDLRTVWELNRLQFLVDLGRAYRVTGDEKFALAWRDHLLSWAGRNPCGRTVNWSSALEVGLRALSIAVSLPCLRDSRALREDSLREKISRLLYMHGAYVESHLSQPSNAFNHLAGEGAALAVLGVCLPGLPAAGSWLEKGKWALEDAVFRLILEDGGPLEGSLHYLGFVCQCAVLSGVVCESRDERLLSREALERLARAYRFLCGTTGGGKQVSEFGDSDSAWLPEPPCGAGLRERYNSLLSRLWLFCAQDRGLLHDFRPDPGCTWLFGEERVRSAAAGPRAETMPAGRSYPSSGRYVVHTDEGDREVFLRFECGHWGDGGQWAHAHADRLSFSLFLGGRPMLIDPGTGSYLADMRAREYFRSTAAHNTLCLDNRSQAVPLGCFHWKAGIESTMERFEENDGVFLIEGRHSGYTSSLPGARAGLEHRRRLTLDSREARLEIEDSVALDRERLVELSFVFHPDCELGSDSGLLRVYNRGVELTLEPDSRLEARTVRGAHDPLRGWYSGAFMDREPCWQAVLGSRLSGPVLLRTVIRWRTV